MIRRVYCQISPNKNKSPSLWHVTNILVSCIFGLWAALTALEFYLVLHRVPMFSFFSGLQIIWHQVTLWLSIRTWKCICETVHIQFRVHPRFEYKVPVIQIKGQLYQNSQKVFVFKFINMIFCFVILFGGTTFIIGCVLEHLFLLAPFIILLKVRWFRNVFGVFNFFQKTNENTSHSSKNKSICLFFGRIHNLTICFRN